MLGAGIAVYRFRHVLLEVQIVLGCRHQAELARGHDDPLAHLPVTGAVLLDGVRVVVLGVAAKNVASIIQAVDVLGPEHTGSGGKDSRPENVTRLDQVSVGQYIGGSRLRVAGGGNSVREIGEVLPHLGLVNA